MKDATYPKKAFALKLLCMGGNWLGTAAANDGSPKGTLIREIKEELSVKRPLGPVDDAELAQIFGHAVSTRTVDRKNVDPSEGDLDDLEAVKRAIIDSLFHLGDYIEFVPRIVFDRADPENKTGDVQGFASVWMAGLDDDVWAKLVRIQEKFGNLSSESISVITSLDEIVAKHLETGWSQDRILRDFFRRFGFPETDRFPLIPDVKATRMDESYTSYDEYMQHYSVVKHP